MNGATVCWNMNEYDCEKEITLNFGKYAAKEQSLKRNVYESLQMDSMRFTVEAKDIGLTSDNETLIHRVKKGLVIYCYIAVQKQSC